MTGTKQKTQHQTEIAARLRTGLKRARFSQLLDFILPPLCIHCQKPVAEQGHLCGPCWGNVDFITAPLCDVTGLPLPYDSGPPGDSVPVEAKGACRRKLISPLALSHPPVCDRTRSVALFGDVMQSLIHGFKYGDRREGLALFGRWMVLAGGDLLADADLLLPVPLSRTRLWHRRFNQSALLAFEVARLTAIPVDVLALQRHRATRSQVGLSKQQRRTNVAGAFVLASRRKNLVRDRNIVLIDDVLTTGSTVDACARILKEAGAKRVDVLVLARAGSLEGLNL